MAASPAPHAHQVKVREVATGHVFLAWPVDAREMVRHASGSHQYAPDDAPLGAPDAPVATPAPPRPIREQLDAKSYSELQALARRAGLSASQKKPELIEALVPHVEGGAISLVEIQPLAVPATQFPNATAAE